VALRARPRGDAGPHDAAEHHDVPHRDQPGAELPRAARGGRPDRPGDRRGRRPPGGAGGGRRRERGAGTRHPRDAPAHPGPPPLAAHRQGRRRDVAVVRRLPAGAALPVVDRPRRRHVPERGRRHPPRRHPAGSVPDRRRAAGHDLLAVQRAQPGAQLLPAPRALRAPPAAGRGLARLGRGDAAEAGPVHVRPAVPGAARHQRPHADAGPVAARRTGAGRCRDPGPRPGSRRATLSSPEGG